MEQSIEDCKQSVEQLIQLYEDIDEQVDGFIAKQDVGMKLTTLKSIKQDIERQLEDN
jgi:hypothetical protein